jgi:hypothetical protein
MFQTNFLKKMTTQIYVHNFFPENRDIYEIMWKNNVERGRPQMIKWHMRIACWTTKATNTHAEYVIRIAFPLQQWLQKCASLLHYA